VASVPEIACKTPKVWTSAGLKQMTRDLTTKKYPHLKGPNNANALARAAAREAGLDIDTYNAIISGKIKKYTSGGKDVRPKPVSAVPNPKTSTARPSTKDPIAVTNTKPFVAEVVDVAGDSVKFDWSSVSSGIKNANHRQVVDSVLDQMSRLVGKDALTRIKVDVLPNAKMPGGGLGAHVGNKVLLNSDLFSNKFVSEAAKMQKSGFWVKTKNLTGSEATMVHEIGHDLVELYMTPDIAKTALSGLAKEIGAPLNFGQPSFVSRWLEKNADVIGAKVSRYGAEDFHELCAEMWTMYVDDPLGCPSYIKQFGDTIVSRTRP
jgi:hypothetical protein